MPDYQALKVKLQELVDRKWDLPAIEARIAIGIIIESLAPPA